MLICCGFGAAGRGVGRSRVGEGGIPPGSLTDRKWREGGWVVVGSRGGGASLHSSHRCLTEKIFSQLEEEKGGKNKVSLRGAVSRRWWRRNPHPNTPCQYSPSWRPGWGDSDCSHLPLFPISHLVVGRR